MKQLRFLFYSMVLSCGVSANAANFCDNYLNDQISLTYSEGMRYEVERLRELAINTYRCALEKRQDVAKLHSDLLAGEIVQFENAHYDDPYAITAASWVSDRVDISGESGGSYTFEVIHPIYVSGIGTGLFEGVLNNFRSLIQVEVMDLIRTLEDPSGTDSSTVTIEFVKPL